MPIPASRLATCNRCGKQVMFITVHGSKQRIPLDVGVPVFVRVTEPDTDTAFWIEDRTEEVFVSHFATCTGRSSGGRRA